MRSAVVNGTLFLLKRMTKCTLGYLCLQVPFLFVKSMDLTLECFYLFCLFSSHHLRLFQFVEHLFVFYFDVSMVFELSIFDIQFCL